MNKINPFNLLACTLFTLMVSNTVSHACSRFTYTAAPSLIITGRSMDWVEDLHSDIWAFPAGIERKGSQTAQAVTWTAKYGSVITSGYDIGTADGINTQGLNANLLFLASSQYPAVRPDRKDLSVLHWVQYVLDNYASVDEAVRDLGQDKLNILAPILPNGVQATVHLSITDPTGDNAIFEYIDGKLVIHQNKKFNVMTNEPTYDKQLALNDYWQRFEGQFLPGTGEPDDRFVRASFYVNHAPTNIEDNKAIAVAFSIIRNVSVPMLVGTPTRPNVSATLWRSVADLTHRLYFFENTDRPNVFWVNLNKLNLNPHAPIQKLALQHGEIYAGEVSGKFIASNPTF